MQKIRKFLLWGVLFFIGIVGIAFMQNTRVKASSRVIKVGFFPMSGYHVSLEDGRRSGYGYEYLQELGKYMDCTFEFVEMDYAHCLELLQNGDIDILTCVKYSPEREKYLDYTDYAMGVSYMMLTTKDQGQEYYYNDFTQCDNKTIGVFEGAYAGQSWKRICQEEGITTNIKSYNTEPEIIEALQTGEIDMILSSNYRAIENEKVIAQFDTAPFYIVVKKGEQQILDMLNKGMEEANIRTPYFEKNLYNKYYGANLGYSLALSKEETEYVAGKKKIRAVIGTPEKPLFYVSQGEWRGVIADSVKKIVQSVGLDIEFVESGTYQDGMQAVKNGEADILCEMYADYGWAEQKEVLLTEPYIQVRYVAVTRRDNPATNTGKAATCKDYFFNEIYLEDYYEDGRIAYYDSEKACMDAVLSGEASIAYINEYEADYLLHQDKYLPLSGTNILTSEHKLGIAVYKGEKMLCSILDKAIANMQQQEIEEIVEEHISDRDKAVTLKSFIYYNSSKFMWIAIGVFLLIILALVLGLQRMKYNSAYNYKMAYQDEKTGLFNRKWLEEEGCRTIIENRSKKFFLLSFDISRFSVINDTYGRKEGDQVIRFVAEQVEELIEADGIVVRNTVDRFLVLQSYKTEEDIEHFITALRSKCSVYRTKNREIGLIFNCGVYILEEGIVFERALDMAEIARKQSKTERGSTRYYDEEMETKAAMEKAIEDAMAEALADEELMPYYQPKFNMKTGKIVGAEALVRWMSKKRGFLSPDEFIPVFEGNGFVVEMDFFILDKVCAFLQEELEKGQTPVPISVNQSRLHFLQENYLQRLDEILDRHHIPRNLIELEVTETILVNTENIDEIMKELKRRGYLLSIDDFGSGFSSLNTLTEYTFDTLKIDRKFLLDKDGSGRNMKVIKKVVELAEELNLNVICEGVETIEQAEFLKSIGCDYAQGFLYAQPLQEEEFLKMLRNGENTGNEN